MADGTTEITEKAQRAQRGFLHLPEAHLQNGRAYLFIVPCFAKYLKVIKFASATGYR
jgi:hypothetical protein